MTMFANDKLFVDKHKQGEIVQVVSAGIVDGNTQNMKDPAVFILAKIVSITYSRFRQNLQVSATKRNIGIISKNRDQC